MDTLLMTQAQEVLSRLEGRPPAGPQPQLLTCAGGRCLLRDANGVRETAEADLPARVDLAPLIDHTLLKADARKGDVDRLCAEAREFAFASVCVNPLWVPRAAAALQGGPVRVCTVVGFPLGACTGTSVAAQAREALDLGAAEIDMVLPVGPARDGDWDLVRRDLDTVRAATSGAVLKLILETCLLEDAQKAMACRLAREAGLDFVKTSTGFSSGGATLADVALMRREAGPAMGVKASGGIRDYPAALAMVKAGATRLGVSASLVIVGAGAPAGSGY